MGNAENLEYLYYRDREYLLEDRTYGSGFYNTYFGKLLGANITPPENKVLGVDVSHWNGFSNFHLMKSKGVQFGILKATDVGWGSKKPFLDERAIYNYNGMKNAGIPVGAYCWLDPHPYSTPEQQANFFLDEFYFKYSTNIPPVLDFEDRDVISWNNMLWRAQVWLEIVERKTGKLPIVYTSPGYMSFFDKTKSGFLGRYPLWIAHYIQRSYPTIPYPWKKYVMWQYSDRGNYPYYVYPATGYYGREWGSDSGYLDMNWFNGTYDDLLKFCKNQETPNPEPPPPAEDFLFTAKCTATYLLNVRKGPGTMYAIVSTIGNGTIHKVYEEKIGWYRIGENQWVSSFYMMKIPITPDPEKPKPLFQAKCIVDKLNKRSGPSTSYKIVGFITRNTIVDVYEIKYSWYRIDPIMQIWVSGYPTYMQRI